MLRSGSFLSRKYLSVGSIVIGDEILKGYVQDTNTAFLASTLFKNGVKLSQIAVLPDDKNLIAEHVALFSSKFDIVITSGGIGPTHDDITFESVAQAFDEDVAIDSELRKIVRKIFGDVEDDSPHMKLCTIPRSSKLLFKGPDGTSFRYPIVTVNNVYVLPGIPSLFERAISNVVGYWAQDVALHKKTIRLKCHETDVADILTNASKLFSDVNIGSYPSWTNNYEKVLITIDSDNLERVERCEEFLVEHIEADKMVDENINCEPWTLDGADVLKLQEEDSQLGEKVRKAMDVIEEAIEKYGDGLSLAFNGGKDCTVLLHLYFAALKKNKSSSRIKSIYIESDKSEMFEEMDEFLEISHKRYDVDVISTNGEIKEALFKIKRSNPSIGAIIMGTRFDDPHGKYLKDFSPTDTDKGWPEYMRVNPILTWDYTDIWGFLRKLYVPYCILYDRGYSSIGPKSKTFPNPDLVSKDALGKVIVKPAYTLVNNELERSGRN
ncbi:unnamed protein product [Oikopleura dioica]|uniref:FAD synthase n=1 Tax=Oikopleura dioica TaxID=34765 RepID=E4Y5A8_OIKDI|nr:unnamed protein product [Oikopleura dioica]